MNTLRDHYNLVRPINREEAEKLIQFIGRDIQADIIDIDKDSSENPVATIYRYCNGKEVHSYTYKKINGRDRIIESRGNQNVIHTVLTFSVDKKGDRDRPYTGISLVAETPSEMRRDLTKILHDHIGGCCFVDYFEPQSVENTSV